MAEADKIAKRLRKDGWTVDKQDNGGAGKWTASHPDTDVTIMFTRNPRAQRIMDQADAALGRTPRTTSGINRKAKAAREREQQQQQEAARTKALAELADSKDMLSVIKSASLHALQRAYERGIGYDDIYDTLLRPTRIEEGDTPHTQIVVGPSCTVVVDYQGAIVTVWKRGQNDD